MKLLHIIPLLTLFSLHGFAQIKNAKNEATQLKRVLAQYHVSPPAVDDRFSRIVFDQFLSVLDPDRVYFTDADLETLKIFREKIDDDLNTTSWNFLPAMLSIYKKSLERVQQIVIATTEKPFEFTTKDFFIVDTNWVANEQVLRQRWYSLLKYEILELLMDLRRNDDKSSDKEFIQKQEPEARKSIKLAKLRLIKKVLQNPDGYEHYVTTLFLRSITTSFDPHSAYLSPTQMQNFISSLSTQGYYFGISVSESERGDIVIHQLTPGGPAWKSGEIHTGDIVEQIRWENKEWIPLSGMTQEEVNDLLSQSNHNYMEFGLKRPGGIVKTVRLRKEKMETEDNVVRSFILEGNRKIGYIALPDFYTNWGETEGSRCANDVAREIIKLKKENIEGLILDVRFNGGGSLYEAVAMAGIFIDAGPIGVLKNRAGEVFSVKDVSRGTVYDGPLVLMVNGLSASASEFLAAAMQDYHRAIIVGSPTFGKATGQLMFSLEPAKPQINFSSINTKSGFGYSTVTTEKIYRITGKSAQQVGVKPDIVLPDIYDHLQYRESQMALALPTDSVQKKTYYQPLPLLPIPVLQHKSKLRVAGNKSFQTIQLLARKLGQSEAIAGVPLLWEEYKKVADEKWNQFAEIEPSSVATNRAFEVSTHTFDQQRMQLDDYIHGINTAWIKNLEGDVFLEEAFYIICDYTDLK